MRGKYELQNKHSSPPPFVVSMVTISRWAIILAGDDFTYSTPSIPSAKAMIPTTQSEQCLTQEGLNIFHLLSVSSPQHKTLSKTLITRWFMGFAGLKCSYCFRAEQDSKIYGLYAKFSQLSYFHLEIRIVCLHLWKSPSSNLLVTWLLMKVFDYLPLMKRAVQIHSALLILFIFLITIRFVDNCQTCVSHFRWEFVQPLFSFMTFLQ